MKSDLKDFLQTFAAEGKVSDAAGRADDAAFWETHLCSLSLMSHDHGLVSRQVVTPGDIHQFFEQQQSRKRQRFDSGGLHCT